MHSDFKNTFIGFSFLRANSVVENYEIDYSEDGYYKEKLVKYGNV